MEELLDNIENFKYIPTYLLDNKCFACGKDNPEGLQMKFYTYDKYVLSKVYLHEHKRGWEQIVHGGILSTILDEIMGWTALYFTKCFMVTKSININYISPVTINTTVKTIGWVEKQNSPKEIQLKARLYNENNKLCAEATSTYALFSKKLAQKLKLMSKETIDQFDTFINTYSKEEK